MSEKKKSAYARQGEGKIFTKGKGDVKIKQDKLFDDIYIREN